MFDLLVMLGFILLIGGAVAVLIGKVAEGRLVAPGWAAVILGVIFLLVGYVFPNAELAASNAPTIVDTYQLL